MPLKAKEAAEAGVNGGEVSRDMVAEVGREVGGLE